MTTPTFAFSLNIRLLFDTGVEKCSCCLSKKWLSAYTNTLFHSFLNFVFSFIDCRIKWNIRMTSLINLITINSTFIFFLILPGSIQYIFFYICLFIVQVFNKNPCFAWSLKSKKFPKNHWSVSVNLLPQLKSGKSQRFKI